MGSGRTIMITGGAGFIGSALIRHLLAHTELTVVNMDALTYAASPNTLRSYENHLRYRFVRADIRDSVAVRTTLAKYRPVGLINLAAETHVDRSIDEPFAFVHTNVLGTCTLLQAALEFWLSLPEADRATFRFHHVSTDEVYGSLDGPGAFSEKTPYSPNSPYSASKASSDHFVRAWHRTHGLPVIISRSSNNFGPYQFPEKLIPLTTIKALRGESLPVYGKGENVRDWLFVEDHARALWLIFKKCSPGDSYNVASSTECRNIDVVKKVCALLDSLEPDSRLGAREQLIKFVTDRPGHDLRYAVDTKKIEKELGWKPKVKFDEGLRQTVRWYLDNRAWWEEVLTKRYDGARLGLGNTVA